jgi:hypothetical protein
LNGELNITQEAMTNNAIPILSLIVAGLAVFVGPWVSWLITRHQTNAAVHLANVTERRARCQEAHTLLDRLENNLDNTKELHESHQACLQWYASHSLSLSKETRRLFDIACRRSGGIFSIIGGTSRRTADESKAVETAHDAVWEAIKAVAAEHEELRGTGP